MMDFLNQNIIDSIIKGVIAGYKDYVNVRNDVNRKMFISNAYAFVRSNHIEDQVAKHVRNEVDFSKNNAGPSWKFLKFDYTNDEASQNITFILKNEDYFNENEVTKGKNIMGNAKDKEKKYILPLIYQNKNINFPDLKKTIKQEHQITADNLLFDEECEKDNENIVSHFNIITYKIDAESRQLVSIKLWIPDPNTNQAILIKDLSTQMSNIIKDKEEYYIEDESLEVLRNSDSEPNLVDVESAFGFVLEQDTSAVNDKG